MSKWWCKIWVCRGGSTLFLVFKHKQGHTDEQTREEVIPKTAPPIQGCLTGEIERKSRSPSTNTKTINLRKRLESSALPQFSYVRSRTEIRARNYKFVKERFLESIVSVLTEKDLLILYTDKQAYNYTRQWPKWCINTCILWDNRKEEFFSPGLHKSQARLEVEDWRQFDQMTGSQNDACPQ